MDADLSDFYAELASIDQNDASAQAAPAAPPGVAPPPAAVIGPFGPPPGFEGARASAPIGPSMPPPSVVPPPTAPTRPAAVDPNSIAAKLAALKAAKQKAATEVKEHPPSASPLPAPVPPPPMRPPGFAGAGGPPTVAPPTAGGPPRVAPPRPGIPPVGPPVVAAPTGFAGPPVVASGFMGVPVPPTPAEGGKPGKGEKSKFFREAAGKVWADPTLAEWPENDFRIFVGNLAQDVTDDILAKAFAKYSSFSRAKVVKNRKNSKTKGYGFVSFADGADMLLALREMNNKYVGSRPVQLKRSDWKDRDCGAGEAEKRLREQQAAGGQAKKRKRYHLPTVHLKES